MKIIEKDILTVESGIICQQVNCQGKMNSGLAKSIREKWPIVYDDYMVSYGTRKDAKFDLLGHIKISKVGYNLWVANIFGQLNFGYDGMRYTDYAALNKGFKRLEDKIDMAELEGKETQVYFPFNFGCDRGGADWEIVSEMIDYYFPDAIICKIPQKS